MEAADSLANANADVGHEHDAVHAVSVLEATTRAYQDALSIEKDTKANYDASKNAADSAKKRLETARIARSIAWTKLTQAFSKVDNHARERDLATSTQEGKFFVKIKINDASVLQHTHIHVEAIIRTVEAADALTVKKT